MSCLYSSVMKRLLGFDTNRPKRVKGRLFAAASCFASFMVMRPALYALPTTPAPPAEMRAAVTAGLPKGTAIDTASRVAQTGSSWKYRTTFWGSQLHCRFSYRMPAIFTNSPMNAWAVTAGVVA